MGKPTFLDPLIGKAAGQTELVNAERGAVLSTHVEPAFDSKSRKKGLLGRGSIPEDYALVIAPCSAIHTFSMRVPIDAVFVARDGRITKTCRAIRPGRLAGSFGAFAVIEAAPGFIDRHELLLGESLAIREIANRRRATDALPPLAATPPESPAGPHSRQLGARRRVTLADVIAAKEPLSWFESIAIIQELCASAIARGPAGDLRVPELKHIELTAEGTVALLGEGPSGHSAVQRTGLVALALTPEAQLPLQLRLLILEEVSPKPRLQTLADLHHELEFYERPDRRAIVRSVYDRFQRQFAQALVGAIPPPLLEPPTPKSGRRWWKQRGLWTGVAIVVATTLVGAAIWAWPRPEGAWMRNGVRRSYAFAKDTGARAYQGARREIGAFTWRLGFRPREAVPDLALQVVPASGNPSGGSGPRSLRGTAQGGAAATGVAPQLPPVQLPQAPLAEPPAPRTAAPLTAEPLDTSAATVAIPPYVYSAADKVVTPPRLLSTTPSARTAGTGNVASLAQVEVTISPSGEVESVRLVSGGIGTLSGMQLSAVKAWRFTPATLNGKAVRYRQRFLLPAP